MDRLLKPRVLKENGVLYFKGTGKMNSVIKLDQVNKREIIHENAR